MDFYTAALRIMNGEFTEADIASYDFNINHVQQGLFREATETFSVFGDSDSETEALYVSSTLEKQFYHCCLLHLALIAMSRAAVAGNPETIARNRKAVEALLEHGADPALICVITERGTLFVPPYVKELGFILCNAADLAEYFGLSDLVDAIKTKLAKRNTATAQDMGGAELKAPEDSALKLTQASRPSPAFPPTITAFLKTKPKASGPSQAEIFELQ